MIVPDVVGYPLSEARTILCEQGVKISQIKTVAPPRETDIEYDENYRVLRVEIQEDDTVKLLICKPL